MVGCRYLQGCAEKRPTAETPPDCNAPPEGNGSVSWATFDSFLVVFVYLVRFWSRFLFEALERFVVFGLVQGHLLQVCLCQSCRTNTELQTGPSPLNKGKRLSSPSPTEEGCPLPPSSASAESSSSSSSSGSVTSSYSGNRNGDVSTLVSTQTQTLTVDYGRKKKTCGVNES